MTMLKGGDSNYFFSRLAGISMISVSSVPLTRFIAIFLFFCHPQKECKKKKNHCLSFKSMMISMVILPQIVKRRRDGGKGGK